jgi:hypothetical protein
VWLAAGASDPPKIDHTTAFQYVSSVRFRFERAPGSVIGAEDSATWMGQLVERQIDRVWLLAGLSSGQLEERVASAFIGGSSWAMLATAGDRQELWRSEWQLGDREAPDRRIWHVVHQGAPIADVAVARPSLAKAEQELLGALVQVHAFAEDHDLESWASWFDDALHVTKETSPQAKFHPDLFPPNGYDSSARRLLATAVNSWVFGGMGSWNDLGSFGDKDDARYRELTNRLWSAMMQAFVSATNSQLAL